MIYRFSSCIMFFTPLRIQMKHTARENNRKNKPRNLNSYTDDYNKMAEN